MKYCLKMRGLNMENKDLIKIREITEALMKTPDNRTTFELVTKLEKLANKKWVKKDILSKEYVKALEENGLLHNVKMDSRDAIEDMQDNIKSGIIKIYLISGKSAIEGTSPNYDGVFDSVVKMIYTDGLYGHEYWKPKINQGGKGRLLKIKRQKV
jgi:hypothetical protein